MHNIPLALQCIHGPIDEGGENEGGNMGSDILVGSERMEITWLFVCRGLISV